MQNNSDENFENRLQDILEPDDPQSQSPPLSSPKESESRHALQKPPPSRQYPFWLETLVRVIAAIAAIALLLLFGVQILNR